MEVKQLTEGTFELTPSDGNHERIVRLCTIYQMNYEDVLTYMFSFAMYMVQTRILNKIDNPE